MQKTVVITGCSSGIGRVAAIDLRHRGYRVLATCRKPADVARLVDEGFEALVLDLDDEASVDAAADQIIALAGNRLWGLFNNAGYGMYGPLADLTRRQLEQQFASNLFGTHQLTRRLLPAMLPHGEGRIIQTSSIMGLVCTPDRGAYAASKHALEAWSDTLRMELHDTGLYVSLIEPGPISTAFTSNVNLSRADKPVTNPGIAKRFTLPAQAILPKLHHALEHPRPRLRYPVTLVASCLSLLRRLLPGRYLDMILRASH
ncbi:SDR family oxidoreductase [Acerihabitans sp. TG2]|uniref:SDR family oxidoreductase n=1 Tax=Acerihabitans sp. TG2 TaxID=3096008 RepID=UPI002B22763F|nr:SDR family oxidoreductase [Acerihabitans sp. TG2]MEA9390844.1 SDR family oxidoreductase [Acerihabitans sp. TG2]